MSIARATIPVPTTGEGTLVSVQTLVGPKTVVFSGTFTGSYDLLGSHDDSHFVPLLRFDAGGVEGVKQTISGAFSSMRLRAATPTTAPGAGVTCEVSAVEGIGENSFGTVATVAAGAQGLTAVVDTQSIFSPSGPEEDICFLCEGGFEGLVTVLGSNDGTDFCPVGSFRADRTPDGAPSSVEFTPLASPDKVRYVRLQVNAVVTSAVTVTIGGRVPAGSTGPVQAWWPLNQVGYFFVDGDNGNDANAGYIIASPGATFTPAQAAAVAVKTTSRLEELRPLDGAGRMMVTLFKPRAGGAHYDHEPGDGQGREDRRRLTNYSLMHTRGSDLTNSASDKSQLGHSTVDGPYTVQSTTSTADGLVVTCTGPIATSVFNLPLLRARFSTAGGDVYAPIRWGDTTTSPLTNPNIVTLWSGFGAGVAPGDLLYLERPATVLQFYEAPYFEANDNQRHPLLAAGLRTDSGSAYGCAFSVESYEPSFNPTYAGQESGTSLVGGNLFASAAYYDEATVIRNAGTGLVANGGLTCSEHVTAFGVSQSYVGALSTLRAPYLSLYQSSLLSAVTLSDGSVRAHLNQVDYGNVILSTSGRCELQACRYVQGWGTGIDVDPLSGASVSGPSEATFSFSDVKVLYPPVVMDDFWITLYAGQYSVIFDHGDGTDLTVGLGARIYYDAPASSTTPFSDVTWESLKVTGFEVEGGQRVTCRLTGQNYQNDVLPCPRGVLMRLEDGVVGTTYPAGMVVAPSATAGRLRLAQAGVTSGIAGVALTNLVQGDVTYNWGWTVVNSDLVVALRREAGSPFPAAGDSLYLSATAPGYVTRNAPATPVLLAAALPVGPMVAGAGDVVTSAWGSAGGGVLGLFANWDQSLVRYVFLDGDSGDDANVGYIDAAWGTVFTPAQTDPVAIKTTSRLEQLRPIFGCGRKMIVLAKPRAGFAPYDHVAGDGLGRDDRRLLSGYTMMQFRGSDLTDSTDDIRQLGCATDLAGTNPDGSYNITGVSGGSDGTEITVDGNIPTGADLLKYRARIIHSGSTLYAACRWSSISDALSNKFLAWFVPGAVSPGDVVYFERPGTVISEFHEAAGYELADSSSVPQGSVLAGVQSSGCEAGALDGSLPSIFCTVYCTGTLSASGAEAKVICYGNYIGAAGVMIYSSYGMVASKVAFFGGEFTFNHSAQYDPGDPESNVRTDLISMYSCNLAYIALQGGGKQFQLDYANYGRLTLKPTGGVVKTTSLRGITAWTPNIMVIPGNSSTSYEGGATLSFASVYNLRIVAEGGEPASPGFTLYGGRYDVVLNFRDDSGNNSLSPGTGVRLYVDESATLSLPVITYSSLKTTGFEIEGAQKITCRYNGSNYAGNLLPCPRGIVMRMVDGTPGTPHDVGLVVTAPAANPDRFDIALADAAGNCRVVGTLLTNAEEAGYAVVGCDVLMVLRQEGGSGNPTSGDLLYLSDTEAGTVSTAVGTVNVNVGRTAPMGPNTVGAGTLVPTCWKPF